MSRFLGFVHLLVAVAMCGCTTWTKKGDAFVSDGKAHWGFMVAPPTYHMRLPAVKIGAVGSTTIRVRDLPKPIFPEYATIEVPYAQSYEWVRDQPWRNAVFQFTFRTTEGATLGTTRVALQDWRGGSLPGDLSTTRKLNFRIAPWSSSAWSGHPEPPDVLNYDLTVDVVVPWLHPHSLTMEAREPNPSRPVLEPVKESAQR